MEAAQYLQTLDVYCQIARPDGISKCSAANKISVNARDLSVEYTIGAEKLKDKNGESTKVPQSIDLKIHPRKARTTWLVGGTLDTLTENARPDNKQVLRLGVQHRLKNATIELKAQREWHESGNRINQVAILHSSNPGKGANLKLQALYRDAKFSEYGVWSPSSGAVQATAEYQQAFPFSASVAAQVGVRAGVAISGGDVSPIVGGGFGVQQQFNRNSSAAIYGTIGHGITTGVRFQHRW
jgi:hypothetical protein